jgi:hypothetical protein
MYVRCEQVRHKDIFFKNHRSESYKTRSVVHYDLLIWSKHFSAHVVLESNVCFARFAFQHVKRGTFSNTKFVENAFAVL